MNKQVTIKLDCVMVVMLTVALKRHNRQVCGTLAAVKLELKSF